MKLRDRQVDPWRSASLVILGVIVYFQILQWPFYPKFLDLYYHLAVMKGFDQAGGYVTQAFWEAAPAGRPHLYPPLLHLAMLALYRSGLSEIDVARAVSVFLYPFLAMVFYAVSTRLFSKRGAFYSLLLFASSYPLYLTIVTFPAFSLAFGLALLSLLRISQRRMFSGCLYLTLAFYTHTGAAFLGMFSILIYAATEPSFGIAGIRCLVASLFLAAPILGLQWTHRTFFHFSDVLDNRRFDLEWVFLLLGFAGMRIVRKTYPEAFRFSFSLIFGALPMVFTHQQRYFDGYGFMGFILFSAAALDALHARAVGTRYSIVMNRLIPVILSVFFLFICPLSHVDSGKLSWSAFDRTFSHSWFPENKTLGIGGKDLSGYMPKVVNPVIDVIRMKAKPADILWSNLDYLGGLIAASTQLRLSNRMMSEVSPYYPFDPQKESRWHIYFKYPRPDYSQELKKALARYSLHFFADTGYALIYKNEAETAPDNRVSAPYIFKEPCLLLIGLLCMSSLIFFELERC